MPVPLTLSLQRWCTSSCEQRTRRYELFGVIFHTGASSFCGHYTAFVNRSYCEENLAAAAAAAATGGANNGHAGKSTDASDAAAAAAAAAAAGSASAINPPHTSSSSSSSSSSSPSSSSRTLSNEWVHFDDAYVDVIDTRKLISLCSPVSTSSSTAYILFYSAVDQ